MLWGVNPVLENLLAVTCKDLFCFLLPGPLTNPFFPISRTRHSSDLKDLKMKAPGSPFFLPPYGNPWCLLCLWNCFPSSIMYRSGISLELFGKLNFCSWFWSPNDRVLAKRTDCWLARKQHFFSFSAIVDLNTAWLSVFVMLFWQNAAVHRKHSIWYGNSLRISEKMNEPSRPTSPIVALTCDLRFTRTVGEERLHCYSIIF